MTVGRSVLRTLGVRLALGKCLGLARNISQFAYTVDSNMQRTQFKSAQHPEPAYVSTAWGELALRASFLDFHNAMDTGARRFSLRCLLVNPTIHPC